MAEKTKKMRKVEEIVPDAARTVASLRDIGYDTPRAIADLVDNSIAAGATEVDVTFSFAGERSWIRVTDNGAGMDGATLQEALELDVIDLLDALDAAEAENERLWAVVDAAKAEVRAQGYRSSDMARALKALEGEFWFEGSTQ